MQRVSSQLTIVLRIAVPTVWFSSFISLFFLLAWAGRGGQGLMDHKLLWLAMAITLFCGWLLGKLLLWRIYRIDMDDQFMYVSNYFSTYKYPFSEIDAVVPSSIWPSGIFRIELKGKGRFGKNIYFLASKV